MKKKISILLVAVLLVSVCVTGGVWAILSSTSNPVENKFLAKPDIVVKEDPFDGETKSNVKVHVDSSATSLYIRAKIVCTLLDGDNVVATVPAKGTDYTMSLNLGDKTGQWSYNEGDGCYYYHGTVKTGEDTGVLIKECKSLNGKYKLSVEILAQAVEATKEAAKDAWGIDEP